MEAIYHPKNTNLVLSDCFLTNLVETFISGSKTVTAINGKILPEANDTSYRKWLNEYGREKNGILFMVWMFLLTIYVKILSKSVGKTRESIVREITLPQ